MKRIIIIGGGISGLTAAYQLKKRGHTVLLLERSGQIGGAMQTVSEDGFLAERGPNSFRGTEEILDLIDDLAIKDELLIADARAPAYIYYNGQLHPAPMGPGAFIRSRLLTVRGKLRVFLEPFIKAAPANQEESVASFIRRRLGREIHDVMVAPLISGIYAGNTEELSIQAVFPRLAQLEAEYGSLVKGAIKSAKRAKAERAGKPKRRAQRLCSFKSGMRSLPETLAERIGRENIITECENISITRSQTEDHSRFTVKFQHRGQKEEINTISLIIATPAFAAAKLVRPLDDRIADALEAIPYPPLAVVCLIYKQSQFERAISGFGFLAPRNQGVRILGSAWSSSLFPGRAPEGYALLTNFIGGAMDTSVLQMNDRELVEVVQGDLSRVLGIRGEPRVFVITRWERAIPQYTFGHVERVQQIEEGSSRVPGLFFVGNYLRGVSVGDCVRQANQVVERVAGDR